MSLRIRQTRIANHVWALAICLCVFVEAAFAQTVRIVPETIILRGPESSVQVIVESRNADALSARDVTSTAVLRIEDSGIAEVSETGLIVVRGQGTTRLTAIIDGQTSVARVEAVQIQQPPPVSFHRDVNPVLTKSGCNSGGCHGKAEGKNGFRLSLFGFDAAGDHAALTQQARSRRINLALPESSLFLRKGAGLLPHGGGAAIEPDSVSYRRMLRWIREGATLDDASESAFTKIEAYPPSRTFEGLASDVPDRPASENLSSSASQQLRVLAVDADGNQHDVTAECAFESNASTIAEVDAHGRITATGVPGEAAILVRYMEHVTVCRISVPRPATQFVRPAENNFVDRLVWDKLEQVGIQPSPACDDATFLRRVFIDTIGTLPTVEQTRNFLNDTDSQKRDKLIDWLLDRPEYATYWALRWSDLLQVDANRLDANRSFAIYRWLKRQFEQNRPYDEMVRDILLTRGNMQAISPAAFYATLKDAEEAAGSISQLFLGVRIECAQCHHHPFERWSQSDFYAFASFFTGTKQDKKGDGSVWLTLQPGNDLTHPRTGEAVPAAGLGAQSIAQASFAESGPAVDFALLQQTALQHDRRRSLADWMTADDNPFFARLIANRYWAHYFGRGLVDPIDDLRATNPATNEPLLDALAEHIRAVDFDLKALTRTLLTSRVYQLSSESNATNVDDHQYFSRSQTRTIPAEVLLDAICQVTDVPEKFNGWPLGARAIEVWDNRTPSYFFRIFGRPNRTTVCSCERGDSPSITQALHLMNSPELAAKIGDRHGAARRLAQSSLPDEEVVRTVYLSALNRMPSTDEQALLIALLKNPEITRTEAVEDMLWSLINSKEFLYNH
ncbi:MAG: DUF1549 and DUF1553 domain-containing protein [Pirellulaceae bacterium]